MTMLRTGPQGQRSLPGISWRLVLATVAFSLVLTAGCGKDSKQGATKDPPAKDAKDTKDKKAAGEKTLWDNLGGEANVKKVIDDFVASAAGDPKVDFLRGGKFKLDDAGAAKLKKNLVDLVSQHTGGPFKYTGKDMKEVHKGMGITNEQFDALAGHLKAALDKNGAKPEDAKKVLDVVGSTRKDIVEEGGAKADKLFDRLGGRKGIEQVIDDFVAGAAPDPKVDFFRGGKYKVDDAGVAKLKKNLADMVSQASGGPDKYTGKSMEEVHKGMKITQEQFNALAGHLKAALEKNGVKKEDVEAVLGVVGGTAKDIVGK
jgi:hemoglobin